MKSNSAPQGKNCSFGYFQNLSKTPILNSFNRHVLESQTQIKLLKFKGGSLTGFQVDFFFFFFF